jgi:CheY-like chemotaxis protein
MAIVAALPRLNKDTVPALIAALDVKEANVRAELIEVVRQRIERDAVPFLWYFSASRAQPDLVRQKATEALLLLTQTKKASDLPPAKLALTREADRYYRHLVYKDRATPVTVWRWDAKKAELASQALPVTQAEEYHGMRFAREALDLDASYQPAQVVLASLVLEKAYERAGIDQPLPRETLDLLATLNFDVLGAVLRRGLIDRRVPAILGSVKALGDLGDIRAARSGSNSTPVLVQALNYPDRRVQMAAAEALLRIPNQPSSESTARIVELLRRALAAEPEAGGEAARPRAVVAHFNVERANEIARAVRQAGFQVGPDDVARTGRELLNRLARSADVDIVLIDAALPYPELPYLMAQLRADRDSGLLPVLVLSPPDKELHLNRLLERYLYVWVVPEVIWRDPVELKSTLSARISDAMGKPLSNDELKNYAGTAIRWLNRMAVGEVSGYDVRPAADAILKAMRSDDLAALAIEAAGHLPGALPQRELAQFVLDNARNPKLRAGAAIQLARHIQQRGAALSRDQVKGIGDLYLSTKNDPKLKGNLATVLGCLRPDVSESGRRLREYTPPAPAAPAAPEKEK